MNQNKKKGKEKKIITYKQHAIFLAISIFLILK